MTSYPKFDELIQNLEESSDQLVDLIRIVDTVKTLTNRQDELLTGFDMGNKLLRQTAEKSRETQQQVVEAVNRGFNGVSAKTQQILQKGLTDLRLETTKVSQLEEKVITLNDTSKKQSEQQVMAVRQSLAKLEEGINAVKTLTGIAQKTDATLRQTVADGLSFASERADKSADALSQLLRDRVSDMNARLEKGQGTLVVTTEKIAEITTQTRGDNRQFYTDFEKLLRIKLDESKSDIRQLIEHEREQIHHLLRQETKSILEKVEEVAIGMNRQSEDMKRQLKQINDSQKSTRIAIVVIGILLLVIAGVGLAKLFGFL